MESASESDFTGKRVSEYAKRLKVADTLKDINRVFVSDPESKKFFPSTLNEADVLDFRELCKKSSKLFNAAKSFQREAVLKWNPQSDDVTDTLILGMNGLDEAASMETGAIVLKLLADFGLIQLNDDGSWIEGDLDKFVLFFGDLKTVDNINLIQDNIRKSMNGKGFTQLSKQLDVFDKALNRVLDLPGDWHAGLSMLSSIYLLFYESLLEPIQKMLKWQRINKDTRKCYYQSGRLVMLVNTVLTKVMLETFIGSELESLREDFNLLGSEDGSEVTEEDFVCYVAQRFEKYLLDEVQSKDEWRRLCSVFLLMSSDWINFVKAYRKCDSIIVELIYERFAPVWRCLGQSRYLERVWRQQEALLTRFSFNELQTARWNCFSQPYHGTTGKGAHAKDEKLEFLNLDYSRFPKPRTKTAFVSRSRYVGVSKKAKIAVSRFYSIKWGVKKKPPKSASAKFDGPQMKFLYELFAEGATQLLL
jgi:hypothetical protein